MRPSLWFVVPAHGRVALSTVCLMQLSRACAAITAGGIDAAAVVIADDENLDTAHSLGFGTVERDNHFLGRRWNDGYELAGKTGVDYVVPFGSDDWIDPQLILAAPLPGPAEVTCFRLASFVREDGHRLAPLRIPYDGGLGIRIIPAPLVARCGHRPAEEDRARATDASVQRALTRALGRPPRFVYHDLHQHQLVDWKSDVQLNTYADCVRYLNGEESHDPISALAASYPADLLVRMAALYELAEVAA